MPGSSKQLTVKVNLNITKFEQNLNRMINLVNQLDNRINKTTARSNNNGLSRQFQQASRAAEQLGQTAERTGVTIGQTFYRCGRILERMYHRGFMSFISGNQSNFGLRIWETVRKILPKVDYLHNKVDRIRDKAKGVAKSLGDWRNKLQSFNGGLKSSGNLLSSIFNKLKAIAATYLGIMGGRAIIDTSDTITKAKNKLNYNNSQMLGADGTTPMGTISPTALKMTEKTMDKIYTSAQKVKMSYTDMMSNVAKSMTLSSDAFGGNVDNAIRFQEIMAEAYTLGGASIAEQNSSMYQLIQALGSGQLAGDELRSVREGAPLAYKEIEKFCQGVLQTNESLKDLASEGMITSEMVVAAIMQSGDEIDKACQQSYMTFEQFWQKIKNTAIKVFEPIADKLREALAVAVDTGILEKIESVLVSVGNALYRILIVGLKTINWLVDNWYWLRHVIAGALILWASIMLLVAISSAIAGYMAVKAWMKANGVTWKNIFSMLRLAAVIVIIIAAILALIYVFILWRNGAISTTNAIFVALLIVAAAILLIGILLWNIPVIIVAICIAVLAFIFKFLDVVLGVIFGAASVLWNFIITTVASLIKNILTPILTAVDMFANFFGNIFNAPIAAIIHCFGNLADAVLSTLEVIAKGIDSVFGGNLASTVQGWRGSLSTKVDDLVMKMSKGRFEEKSNVTETVMSKIDGIHDKLLWDTSKAWNKGNEVGNNVHNWFDSLGVGTGDGNKKKKKTGLDVDTDLNTWLTDITNPGGENVLEDISDDTGSIKDSVELAEEDLKYLRALADREWKREYTTATIQVDMSNYNTVNGDGDLDGICTKLADKLYEEMSGLANGVY